jgi:hypothetical protein
MPRQPGNGQQKKNYQVLWQGMGDGDEKKVG